MAAAGAAPASAEPAADGEELTGFEGPEKTLDIDFVPGVGPPEGMRALPRDKWDAILALAACSILVEHKTPHMDAYVLSESSLFVQPHKLLIKTCGTTTLLLVLPELLRAAEGLGLRLEWLSYSRKDFLFPQLQRFPHRSMAEELAFLREHVPDGDGHVIGPVTRDHWFVYTADRCERPPAELRDRTLNLMMYGIAADTARCFTRDGLADADAEAAALLKAAADAGTDAEDADLCAGLGRRVEAALRLGEVLPGADTRSWLFEPCGWSLNGVFQPPHRPAGPHASRRAANAVRPGAPDSPAPGSPKRGEASPAPAADPDAGASAAYWTVHVTPEAHCSYVSFETSAKLRSHSALVRALLALFRPTRFTLTLFADRYGLADMTSRPHRGGDDLVVLPGLAYRRLDLCHTEFMGDYSVILGNYEAAAPPAPVDPSQLTACLAASMAETSADLA